MPTDARLHALAERWAPAEASERANFQAYFIELCESLGVTRPGPAGSGYEFELPVKVITRDGVEVANFIDCYRNGYFAIEAKDEEPGRSSDLLLRKAFGQVRHYASHAPGGLPPYLMVMDVARKLVIWDRWNGNYGDWHAGRHVDLMRLADREDDIKLLRAIWTAPTSLDPRARAQAVTKEVAGYLANLARSLEEAGYHQERVARFIMRCVFTMFAEDIGLLSGEPFRHVLQRSADDPTVFPEQAVALWKAMDEGTKFDWKKLMRFNGHFFSDSEALPLSSEAITTMLLAAQADWQDVEPAIFGTLLTRALDPAERHRLGAEFTPRQFVERVVTPTVEQPIRERWSLVQAAVLPLIETVRRLENSQKAADKAKATAARVEARRQLREFHGWMKGLRFLDPACGSGNFLYVTMHLVKRIEIEVLRELDTVGTGEMLFEEVHPRQFYGIELKTWAREIAELVLWIGYHQFWRAHHTQRPLEPVLQDTGTIECRDAVLAWTSIRHDPERDRADPTPRVPHPVTRRMVPDPDAKFPYMEYLGAGPAEWPQADFIIGNPPYLGKSRKRAVLGDGYVDALQRVYPEVPPAADYVMYWWDRAARAVLDGRTIRCGLITTNSLVQRQNRAVVDYWMTRGASPLWAVRDHPWVDELDGAAVRVAMTVLCKEPSTGTIVTVNGDGETIRERSSLRLNADLTIGVDVSRAGAQRLRATKGLATVGFKLYGDGFILCAQEARALVEREPRNQLIVRPLLIGHDVTGRPRGDWVIDFGTRSMEEAATFPTLFDMVRTRVKPHRDANPNADIRARWWQFGHLRQQLRDASVGLSSILVTPETGRHRFFVSLDVYVAPEGSLFCIAVDDPFFLGVLNSKVHRLWAAALAGKMGVGNDYRYNKACIDAFPFPERDAAPSDAIRDLGRRLEAHRRAALERDTLVTMTGMYNVVEKLRNGEALTDAERSLHDVAACGVLSDIHDQLDRLVADAYGWEWPIEGDVVLERLVALHDERIREESAGRVRWLRPDYQVPRFSSDLPAPALGLRERLEPRAENAKRIAFPSDVISQIGAIKRLLAEDALTPTELVARFKGAKVDLVRRHLDILSIMGEIRENPDGRYQTG